MEKQIQELADVLATAWQVGGVAPLTEQTPNLTLEEAYRVQLETVRRALAEGDFVTGKKIGLTSKSMQQSVGVNEPDYGHLLGTMDCSEDGQISFADCLSPRVEGEIAFVLKERLFGPNITALDVIKATDYVVPALEIVDSRIKNWQIKLVDTVADNASSGKYCLSPQRFRLTDLELDKVGMAFYRNDELVNTGIGAACLGHPIQGVVWLANKLATFGLALEAGEVILSGALSAAVDAREGDVFCAKFYGLGEVSVQFTP